LGQDRRAANARPAREPGVHRRARYRENRPGARAMQVHVYVAQLAAVDA